MSFGELPPPPGADIAVLTDVVHITQARAEPAAERIDSCIDISDRDVDVIDVSRRVGRWGLPVRHPEVVVRDRASDHLNDVPAWKRHGAGASTPGPKNGTGTSSSPELAIRSAAASNSSSEKQA